MAITSHWAVESKALRSVPCFGAAALTGLAAVVMLPGVAVTAAREPQMRVLLKQGPRLILRADGDEPMRVRGLSGSEQRLQRLELDQRQLAPGVVVRVENDDPRGIWLGPRRYRGTLLIQAHAGQLQVVNQLGIETYLASVVGSEMPHQWPLAALQAQAVAARTYALKQRGGGKGWDVKATVASQVYRGVESETDSTREAVRSTRSLVLVHRGQLIDAVFHSSSGGATEASGMVWRQQLPYLVSVPDHDQHSPVHRWQERFDAVSLRQRLPETGGLDSVDVLSRSGSGRVRQARIRGPRGVLLLTGSELRRRLGLKSTLVDFEMVSALDRPGLQPLPAIAAPAAATGSGGSRIDRITASVASSGAAVTPVLRSSPPSLLPMRIQGQPAAGPQLLVRGQGYGHGVGMSQWGAHGLAEQGADFRTILQHYYRGAEVVPFRTHHDPSMAQQPQIKPLWRG